VGAYVDADREGQQWLLRYCTGHAIPTHHHLAYTYATTAGGRHSMRAELHAGEQAGLGAVGTGRPSWAVPHRGRSTLGWVWTMATRVISWCGPARAHRCARS